MEGVTVRTAAPVDLDELLRFEQAIIEAERPFDETIKRGPTNYYNIQALIDSPDVEIVVAVFEGRVIASGYARIETSEPYHAHTRHSYLGFMYVVPEFRRKGVNQMIIDALLAWSRQRGVYEICLEVYTENTAAIRAYEKAGFSPSLITMRTRLDPEPPDTI